MKWTAVVVSIIAVACSAPPPAVPPTPSVPPAVPTSTLVPLPTATPRTVVLEPRTPTGEYFLGRADAPVTLEMFGDFQCPACGEFARSIEPTFLKSYVDTGKVKFVWHDYAWIGSESIDAAQGGRCAARQGRFWTFHDYLFAHQRGENLGQFNLDNLSAFASDIGLDRDAFDICMSLEPDRAAIENDLREGVSKGVDVTPAFLINGDLRIGAPPMNRLAALLEFYLARSNR